MKRSSYKSYLGGGQAKIPKQTIWSRNGKKIIPRNVPDQRVLEGDGGASCSAEDPDSTILLDEVNEYDTIYEGCDITNKEFGLLLYAYKVRHNLTKVAIDDLLQIIKTVLPGISSIPSTYRQLKNNMGFNYASTTKHIYCPKCFSYVINRKCPVCDVQIDTEEMLRNGSFFVTYGIRESLEGHLKTREILENISKNLRNRKSVETNHLTSMIHGLFIQHVHQLKVLIERKEGVAVFGINNCSRMLNVPKFDIVKGFVFDYMHTCLLGVTRTFTWTWTTWVDKANHGKDFYITNKMTSTLDYILLKCMVPSTSNRSMTTIKECHFWKANQWRTWNLICPIVLENILPQKYLLHFTQYLKAIYILCCPSVTDEMVDACNKLLHSFVKQIPELYGLEMCSFNCHLLVHAAENVRNWGPLYCYSMFQFENYNGTLTTLFHGNQNVAAQISTSIAELTQLCNHEQYLQAPSVRRLYQHLLSRDLEMATNDATKAVGIGLESKLEISVTTELSRILQTTNVPQVGKIYKKCLIKGRFFSAKSMNTNSRCNSILRTSTDSFHLLYSIISCAGQIFLNTRRLTVEKLSYSVFKVVCADHTKIELLLPCEVYNENFVTLKEIRDNSTTHIICKPNMYELE